MDGLVDVRSSCFATGPLVLCLSLAFSSPTWDETSLVGQLSRWMDEWIHVLDYVLDGGPFPLQCWEPSMPPKLFWCVEFILYFILFLCRNLIRYF